MFDITKWETFHCLNALKADIEKNHGKKESPVIMVLGNKVDLELESRQIDSDIVQKWAGKEKGKLILWSKQFILTTSSVQLFTFTDFHLLQQEVRDLGCI